MEFFGHFIGGEEVPSIDGEEMLDIDPYSRQPWARVALGSSADAERAVAAAREAFDSGVRLPSCSSCSGVDGATDDGARTNFTSRALSPPPPLPEAEEDDDDDEEEEARV